MTFSFRCLCYITEIPFVISEPHFMNLLVVDASYQKNFQKLDSLYEIRLIKYSESTLKRT